MKLCLNILFKEELHNTCSTHVEGTIGPAGGPPEHAVPLPGCVPPLLKQISQSYPSIKIVFVNLHIDKYRFPFIDEHRF